MTIAMCRHCSKVKINRPRGLCWSCYYTPGVKALHPSTSKYAQRGVGNITGNRPLPKVPTDAEPGSEEKIAVLEERAKRGECLFHPRDKKYDTRPSGVPGVRVATVHLRDMPAFMRADVTRDTEPPERIVCAGAFADETPGVFVVPTDAPKKRRAAG